MLMIIGLINGGLALCIQSLPHFTNPQTIVPLKEQMTVNARNGRQERIFVNLEAVYPTPEISGSEMSFEELRACSRGWLSKQWQPERVDVFVLEDTKSLDTAQQPTRLGGEDLVLNQAFAEKLVIPRDAPILDENGAVKETGREGRSRKLKTMEVNETQISKVFYPSSRTVTLTEGSQNQAVLSFGQEAETQGFSGAYNDLSHTCCHR
jgi:checkpoint serine/threonine-protein kinase